MYSVSDIKTEIQETLVSIHEITIKIKTELDTINDLIKKNGQLHTAVVDANGKLTMVAQNMDINVEDILDNDENGNEFQINLRSALSSASFQEKILECLNNK